MPRIFRYLAMSIISCAFFTLANADDMGEAVDFEQAIEEMGGSLSDILSDELSDNLSALIPNFVEPSCLELNCNIEDIKFSAISLLEEIDFFSKFDFYHSPDLPIEITPDFQIGATNGLPLDNEFMPKDERKLDRIMSLSF